MRFDGEDRSLNSVQEIASDPQMLAAAAEKLRQMGGIPARLGNQFKALFENERAGCAEQGRGERAEQRREAPGISGQRPGGQAATARSTFEPGDLLKPGTTLFLQIPPDQLEAQKGLLRCWISTLVRTIKAGR